MEAEPTNGVIMAERAIRFAQLLRDQNETARAMDAVLAESRQLELATRRYMGPVHPKWVVTIDFEIVSSDEYASGQRSRVRVEGLTWDDALQAGQSGFHWSAAIRLVARNDMHYGLRFDAPVGDWLGAPLLLMHQLAVANALQHVAADQLRHLRAEHPGLDRELGEIVDHVCSQVEGMINAAQVLGT